MKQIVFNIRIQKEFLKSINLFKSYDILCLNYLIKKLDKISSISSRITMGKRGVIQSERNSSFRSSEPSQRDAFSTFNTRVLHSRLLVGRDGKRTVT